MSQSLAVKAGKITAEQINDWKNQHKKIFEFSVENDSKFLIIRKPSMNDLERAQASDKKNAKAFNFHRSIISNCKLFCDEGVIDNDENLLAICTKLDEIIEIAEASVKEL
jgi:hypothetical protein